MTRTNLLLIDGGSLLVANTLGGAEAAFLLDSVLESDFNPHELIGNARYLYEIDLDNKRLRGWQKSEDYDLELDLTQEQLLQNYLLTPVHTNEAAPLPAPWQWLDGPAPDPGRYLEAMEAAQSIRRGECLLVAPCRNLAYPFYNPSDGYLDGSCS